MRFLVIVSFLSVACLGKTHAQVTCGNMSTPVITGQTVTIQSATTGGVTVNWTNVSASYSVNYKLSGASQYSVACSSISALSCTINGLSLGSTYNIYVHAHRACQIVGGEPGFDNADSGVITITMPSPAPVAPVNLSANIVTATSFVATWSASTDANSYRLDVSSDGFTTFVNGFNNLTVNGTSQSVTTGLTPGTSYSIRVRAVNASGGTSANSITSFVTTISLPPTNLSVSTITTNSFTASWSASAGAAGYRVDVADNSDFASGMILNNVSVSTTNTSVTDLKGGTKYFFRLRAENSSGVSTNSQTLTAHTILAIPSIQVDSVRSESFLVVWDSIPGATFYLLDVAFDSSFDSLLYTAMRVEGTSQNVPGLEPNRTYYFRVQASNENGVSGYSSQFSATTPDSETGNADGSSLGGFSLSPSPDAAALAKYAEAPVSLYTGTPEITIPIYEIKDHNLSLPVSLNYHGGGNKVEEAAPRTGLGWTLDAGGVVTRTIRGVPDDLKLFFGEQGMATQSDYSNPFHPEAVDLSTVSGKFAKDITVAFRDPEPDVFNFNFAGHTGTFMFDWDGQIKIMSGSSIKIEPIGLLNGSHIFMDGWKITDESGTVFTFTGIDSTLVTLLDSDIDKRMIPQAWYLTEMKSADLTSWIHFQYDKYKQIVWSLPFEVKYYDPALSQNYEKSGIKKLATAYYGQNLRKITTSSGQTVMDFLPGTIPRIDIGGDTTATGAYIYDNYPLDKITVTNINGKKVKGWNFGYDNSTGRLTLLTLTETTGPSSAKPPYQFSYYPGTLPDNASFARDHWGFLNGNPNKSTLIPVHYVVPIDVNAGGVGVARQWPVRFPGAYREPDPGLVLVGMLKQIIYPTGGKDIFEFEQHDYSFVQDKEQTEKIVSNQTLERSVIASNGTAGGIFILEEDGYVTVEASFDANKQNVRVQIWDQYQGTLFYNKTSLYYFFDRIYLPAGEYILDLAMDETGVVYTEDVTVKITYPKIRPGATKIVQGGGARISKITRSSGFGNPDKVTKYSYRMNEGGVIKSAGSLVEPIPDYITPIYVDAKHKSLGDVKGWIRHSINSSATTQGSAVGYGQVTVLYGENSENGKCIYHFTSPRTVNDYINYNDPQNQPFPPAISYDFRRGLMLDQTHFHASGIDTVKTITNQYNFFEQDIHALKGAVGVLTPVPAKIYVDDPNDLTHDPPRQILVDNPQSPWPGDYTLVLYFTPLGYARLVSQSEKLIQPDGAPPVVTTINYTYNETTHKQLVSQSTTNSKGDVIVNAYKYPLDYGTTSGGVSMLQAQHVDNVPVEQLVWKKGTGNQVNLISAFKTIYGSNNNRVFPTFNYSAKISSPILTTDPYGSANNRYEARVAFTNYDGFNNLREQSSIDGVKTSFQWNYSGTIPTAKVENASASLRQIFYESFEEDATASTVAYRTGTKSKLLSSASYSIPTASRPAANGDYILSYWAKEGTAPWNYKEKIIQNYVVGGSISTDVVNGYLDEVRLYPKGAVMVTCTFEPLVGMTSMTDANNVTTYFEYDDFGRLKNVRDQDGNILKNYDYQFNVMIPYKLQGE